MNQEPQGRSQRNPLSDTAPCCPAQTTQSSLQHAALPPCCTILSPHISLNAVFSNTYRTVPSARTTRHVTSRHVSHRATNSSSSSPSYEIQRVSLSPTQSLHSPINISGLSPIQGLHSPITYLWSEPHTKSTLSHKIFQV